MLTIEEIKQAVEEFKPDGFRIKEGISDYFLSVENPDTLSIKEYIYVVNLNTGIIKNTPLYTHFIDTLIQGINRKGNVEIGQNKFVINIWVINKKNLLLIIDHNGKTEGIIEAREKAIRFVLKEGV